MGTTQSLFSGSSIEPRPKTSGPPAKHEKHDSMETKRGIISKNMVTLYVSGFIYGIGGYMWPPFWALYIRSLGASLSQVGFVLSLRGALGVVLNLLGGLLSDRIGRKSLIVIPGYVTVLGYAVYILANSWKQLIIGEVLVAFDSMRWASMQALMAESVDVRDRAKAYAVFETTVSISGIIVPVIVGSIIESQGILVGERMAFVVTIGCVLIANTIRATGLRETLSKEDRQASRGTHIGGSLSERAAEVIHRSSLRTILVSNAIRAFASEAIRPLLVIYCVDYIRVSDTEFGIISGISIAAMLISRIPVARFSDSYGMRRSMLIGGFMYPLWTLSFFLAPSYHWLILAAMIEPVANSFALPARDAYIADLVPANRRAGTFSVILSAMSLSTIPASVIGAMLWEAYGPAATFVLCTVLLVMSGLLLAFSKEETTATERPV